MSNISTRLLSYLVKIIIFNYLLSQMSEIRNYITHAILVSKMYDLNIIKNVIRA